MPGEPVQHDGVWWLQQDNGSWKRFDEATRQWVDHQAPSAPDTAPVLPTAQPTQPAPEVPPPYPVAARSSATPTPNYGVEVQPVQPTAPSKTPMFAIVGVVVLAIAAIAVFAIAGGGGKSGTDGGDGGDGSESSASGSAGAPGGAGSPGAGPAQASLTALACEHKGSGKAYEVGPGKALDSLGKVPWENLAAGDTVLISYRPEPYREKFFLRGKGTAEQPITVCGIAGPNGELPIIDGQNAVARPGMPTPNSGAGEVRSVISITLGANDPWGYKPQYIVVQGLSVRNAFYENTFTNSKGTTVKYTENAAGIFIERGEHIVIRGVEITGNGNGFFVASGDSEEVLSRDILLERSRVYGNGTVKVSADRQHNIYTEAAGMVFQFNDLGPLREGSGGGQLKDRSSGTVVRYNRIEGGARMLDLVDGGDSLTNKQPEYRTSLVYGNIFINGLAGSSNMIHYGGDNGVDAVNRKGTLYFYNNTVISNGNQSGGNNARYRTSLFDATTSAENIDARNNVIVSGPGTPGSPASEMTWMRSEGTLKLGVNWASPEMIEWRDDKPSKGGITGLEKVQGKGNKDPIFTNTAGGNYTLAPGSPAAIAGEPLAEAVVTLKATVDFEYVHPAAGKPRASAAPEMGALTVAGGGAAAAAPSGASAPAAAATPAPSSSSSGSSASAAGAPGKQGATTSGQGKADGWTGSLQYLGKGPNGYDNGQKLACTGAKGGSPSVLCVKAGGNGQGTAAAPFGTINAAIAAASPKDVIQVAAGTYDRVAVGTKAFELVKTELVILGGFSPDFATRNAQQFRSVIDGKGGAGPAVQLHLESGGTSVLDGFRITGGRGLGNNSENGNGQGGGIYAELQGNGELLISHNEVYNNQTSKFEDENRGGGIHADGRTDDGSKPVIRIEDNVVHSNQAGRGAGIQVAGRQAAILRNVVEGNKAHSDHGGGVYISTSSTDIGDNVIRGNEVGVTVKYGWGGGIIIPAANAEMHGNIVTGNYAPSLGSGVFWDEGAKGTMKEDLVFANGCPNEGGWGVYADGGAGPSMITLDHVTVANHNCPNSTGAAITSQDLSKITIKDSIVWGNTKELQAFEKGTFTIANSITATSGSGNKNSDPQFVDAAKGDFHLKPGSPANGLGAYPK